MPTSTGTRLPHGLLHPAAGTSITRYPTSLDCFSNKMHKAKANFPFGGGGEVFNEQGHNPS